MKVVEIEEIYNFYNFVVRLRSFSVSKLHFKFLDFEI
jgi:hypothetical protein